LNDITFYLEDLKSKFTKINFQDYYLSYSGGRDSHFLYWFIKEYLKDNEIKIVTCNTLLEHKEIKERMIKYSDVVLKPKLKPYEIKEKVGIPCFSKMQDDMIMRYQKGSRSISLMQFINGTKNKGKTMFKMNNQAKKLLLNDKLHKISNKCCYYMKKLPFKEYEKESKKKAILGVRSTESILRKAQYTTCFTKEKKFTPIHDLSDDLLHKIEKKYNIEIPQIYKHVSRTGCMGCPYGSHYRDTQKELNMLDRNQREFIYKYFKESYDLLGIKDMGKIEQLSINFDEKSDEIE